MIGVAVIGPDGKVLFKGSSPFNGSTFYVMPGNPPVPYHDLKQGVTPHLGKGLFGGLTVPPAAKMAVKFLRAGNVATGMAMISALKGDANVSAFRDEMMNRLEALRKEKRALFDELVKAEKSWDAYKVGMSYVKCYPKAADLAEVKELVKGLQANPAVKNNLTSKGAYASLAGSGFGSKSKPTLAAPTSAAMGQMSQKYGDTEYGKYAASIAR